MKILITSGGTSEPIDAVRSITNHATGQLGCQLVNLFLARGHKVSLVTTKSAQQPPEHPHLERFFVETTQSLLETLKPLVETHDVLIHSMAVSDYRPLHMTDLATVKANPHLETFLEKSKQNGKIPSTADHQVLFLEKTPKIISFIKQWNPAICLVGFKLLVDEPKANLIEVAKASLKKNQADFIFVNDLSCIDGQNHLGYLVGSDTIDEARTKTAISELIYQGVIRHD